MRKLNFFLVSIFSASLLYSQEIELNRGWSLLGLTQKSTIEELKSKNKEVDEIFIYKGKYLNSGEINPSDGIWIKSMKDIKLSLPTTKFDYENFKRVDKIELKKGWNLISIPTESIISTRVFKDVESILKYRDRKWQSYSKNNELEIKFLQSNEGFWVKVEEDITLLLSDEEAKLVSFNSDDEMLEYLENMVTLNKRFGPNEPQKSAMQQFVWEPTPVSTISPAPFISVTPIPTIIAMPPIPIATAPVTSATPMDMVSYATTTTNPATGEIISTEGDSKVENITTTNLQEKEVDEADILKHDGDKIFYMPSSFEKKEIYITTFNRILDGEKSYLTKIELSEKPTELYLINNKLIVIYPRDSFFWEKWKNVDYELWSGVSRVEVYDVENLENIAKIEEFSIDGNIISSRVTNSKLYLITRYMPYVDIFYPKTYITCDGGSKCMYHGEDVNGLFKYDYANYKIIAKYLMPSIEDKIRETKRELLSKESFFAPLKINQEPFITTVTSFDIKDFSNQNTLSVVGDSETIYASDKAIYSVSQEYPIYYDIDNSRFRSAIYKFSIKDGLVYSGKTFIDGFILNQFSLSEHNDILRVASTTAYSWLGDTDNIVSTISEEDGNLNILGELRGLGLEREKIKGVRFVGDRGFIVTFRRTDPLYTIDLSNPKEPKKVGELKILGYSSYFHPVDEDRILSIGRDAYENGSPKGVQIELFDISDFANPTLADKVTIGTNRTFSEAETNHKAFTYRSSDNLFAIPINGYFEREPIEFEGELYYPQNSLEYKSYLDIYQVDGLTIKSIDKIDGDSSKEEYNYQRSILFSKDAKDYGLYISAGELYFKEIIK